mmetsp:Transcript_6311/g.11241  ORF Transcript_6311/g.11241 Transcript_6311/m.11241 type:complete len:171 (+) Transcript_6311:224-736(+)|eukprot:CAMPEP_0183749134 /NCGR_PEP_ID=MMETSP0737-20130205/68131_1 /TAXON_ID=385413 /ORGANISM="Thalassiosira miniscula, Strain CCMP1093" /LENGTH=170 /DNA_ID=CAMNT_0025984883 /DNA_START=155 /DNA_END=667 /DNA_ORIENTATION=-
MKATLEFFQKINKTSANAEWPEIINVDKIGGERPKLIEPLTSRKTKRVDVNKITSKDLKRMQKKDPFLFYSIPGVRSAKMLLKDIDTSHLGDSQFRNCSSCPSRLETVKFEAQPQTVIRSSRISFECHPDLVLEDDYDDLFDDDTDDCFDPDDEDDDALDFLMEALVEHK